MANTNLLKTVVEKEIIKMYCEKHVASQIELSIKMVKFIFDGTEPDLVAYRAADRTLHLGEITTSGFQGQKGKNFHIGAVKKVFEAFAKFTLWRDDLDTILQRFRECGIDNEVENVVGSFIVPEGCKFIHALGYRNKLFNKGIMTLEVIPLKPETIEVMLEVHHSAKAEIWIKKGDVK